MTYALFAAAAKSCGSKGVLCTNSLPNSGADPTGSAISIGLNILFAIATSIALLVIVIGGLRYIIARGDPSATAQARESIIYAAVGLVITLAAYSIVTFVLKGLG